MLQLKKMLTIKYVVVYEFIISLKTIDRWINYRPIINKNRHVNINGINIILGDAI